MKKILLLIFCAMMFSAANSQVARKLLFEEFSGENCGPCAAVWPTVRAVLDANPSNVILCKYMVAIPSAGSMCTLWSAVTTRQSYYGVNSAPYGRVDGGVIDASQSSPTHPAYFTQAIINARLAVQSPISITVSHTFDATAANVNVSYSVKNEMSGAISGSYVLQMALIESEVKYSSPPGTNGETTFENVVRYMNPNTTAGTAITLPASGATTTGTATIAIPSYVKNKSKLKILVWVQNTSTKEVIQAELGTSVTPANFKDAAVNFDLTGVTVGLCDATFTPKIKIYNTCATPLTSVSIQYGVTGNLQTYNHSSTIAVGDSSSVITLSPVNLTGNQRTTIGLTNCMVNGVADDDASNNESAISIFTTKSAAGALPFTQGFESGTTVGGQTFPNGAVIAGSSAAYIIDKTVATGTGELGGYANSSKVFRFRPFNANFYLEYLSVYLDKVNLSGLTPTDKVKLYYDYSYAKASSGTTDSFLIQASKDCGLSWTTIKAKSADEMSTAPDKNPSTALYYPTSADWKTDSFDISSMNGNSAVMLRLSYRIGPNPTVLGNHFYLDNINIKQLGGSTTAAGSIFPDTTNLTITDLSSLTADNTDVINNYTSVIGGTDVVKWYLAADPKKTIPSTWKFISICDHELCNNYDDTKNWTECKGQFTYKPGPDNNFLKADFEHFKNPGYGYVMIRTWRVGDSAKTSKLVKIALNLVNGIADPKVIILDSVRMNVAIVASSTINSTVQGNFTNIKTGDKVVWTVKDVSKLVTGWTLANVIDHNGTYPYVAGLSKTFDYKTTSGSNFLRADIKHNKKNGYGYVTFEVQKSSDATTKKSFKASLLVSGGASISLLTDQNEKMLYYFEKNVFLDEEFKNSTLTIYDINGKQMLNTLVKSTMVEFEAPKGIYILNVSRNGELLKSNKVSVE